MASVDTPPQRRQGLTETWFCTLQQLHSCCNCRIRLHETIWHLMTRQTVDALFSPVTNSIYTDIATAETICMAQLGLVCKMNSWHKLAQNHQHLGPCWNQVPGLIESYTGLAASCSALKSESCETCQPSNGPTAFPYFNRLSGRWVVCYYDR